MIRKEEWKIYKNVFDSFTLRNIFKLKEHFEDLVHQISIGKEANVFSARKKDGKLVVLKIWRLDNANFKKMFDYIIQDPRYASLKNRKRDIVFSWAQREYRNLLKAREAIPVPNPLSIKHHILLMEFIGTGEVPAPQLQKQHPINPLKFYEQIIKDIKKLYKAGLVHGDLSPYNILNHDEKPIYIDFSQATVTKSSDAEMLLKRDISIINKFFNKYCEVKKDKEVYEHILSKT